MTNFQFYLEKLFASEEFQSFIEENKDAELVSCFFAIDKDGLDNKQHFDYFLPGVKKMFSFKLEDNCAKIPVEDFGENVLGKISDNYSFSFEEIEKMIFGEMVKREIKNKIQKLLISMQSKDGIDFLVVTVFISGMGLISAHINLNEMKITEFEKKSFMDMVKFVGKK